MKTPMNGAAIALPGLILALFAMGSVVVSIGPVFAAPAPAEPGVWQKHRYSFAFLGFTSTYSCDGLADKLKILLLASGARPDVKSLPGACASGFGRPDKFARADLTFYTLAPPSGDAGSGATPVMGVWRPVEFTARKPQQLGIGDCELVEQFKANVLPLFTTRNVDSKTTCIPYQNSGSNIDLQFDSFTAAPKHGTPRTATGAPSG